MCQQGRVEEEEEEEEEEAASARRAQVPTQGKPWRTASLWHVLLHLHHHHRYCSNKHTPPQLSLLGGSQWSCAITTTVVITRGIAMVLRAACTLLNDERLVECSACGWRPPVESQSLK